jgi:hypothetical protein
MFTVQMKLTQAPSQRVTEDNRFEETETVSGVAGGGRFQFLRD